jgi:hypothetical protein
MPFLTWTGGGPNITENWTGIVGTLALNPGFRDITGIIFEPQEGAWSVTHDGTNVTLELLAALDFETAMPLVMPMRVELAVEAVPDFWLQLTRIFTFELTLNDVNEAPTLSVGSSLNTGISEAFRGPLLGLPQIIASDQDAGDVATLALEGADRDLFELVDGVLGIREGAVLDAETDDELNVTVVATDRDGLRSSVEVEVHVYNHAETPDEISQHLAAARGHVDGVIATFADGLPVLINGGEEWLSLPAGTQTVALSDGIIAFNDAPIAMQVYQAMFALTAMRELNPFLPQTVVPDGYLMALAAQMLQDGASLEAASAAVLERSGVLRDVPPASNPLHASSMSDHGFINDLYHAVLGHPGDLEGNAFWRSHLDSGALTRLEVIVGFARSDEVLQRIETDLESRVTWLPDLGQFRLHGLYDIAFDQGPDPEGLAFWTAKLEAGWSLGAIADLFVQSTDFQGLLATRTDAQMIDLLYMQAFGAADDAAGEAFWLNVLANGGDWGDVLRGFAVSDEFAEGAFAYLDGWDFHLG